MITATSCTIVVTSKPRIAPTVPESGNSNYAGFTLVTPMEAIATVTLTGDAAPTRGWSIGWMQAVKFSEWAIYRGPTPKDGSALRQLGNPPATALTTMVDSDSLALPFIEIQGVPARPNSGGAELPCSVWLPDKVSFPLRLQLILQDLPNQTWAYVCANSKTSLPNRLDEAHIELNFCAALALRDPDGRLTFLGGVFWSVIWHDRFGYTPGSAVPFSTLTPSSGRASAGPVFTGAPPDAEFAAILLGRPLTNFNLLLEKRQIREEDSEGWPAWLVRR